MAQKGLAVNQLKTPPGRFMSQGLQTLTTGNTDSGISPKLITSQSRLADKQKEGAKKPTSGNPRASCSRGTGHNHV